VREETKKKEEDLALREGLQPLVKLLSQVPKINSIFHQLRSSRAQSLAFKKFGVSKNHVSRPLEKAQFNESFLLLLLN